MFYLLKRYLHPQNFDATIYTTQCLQADFLEMAIRHLRSHKERCAGSTYWQVNDTYPTISWATIDYYGRGKGAQYVVKRSYAPQGAYVEADEWGKAELYVYSEALKPEKLTYRLALMEQGQEPIREACGELTLEPLSSAKAVEWQLPELDQFRRRDCYLHYEIAKDGIVIDSGNRLLEMPKAFHLFGTAMDCGGCLPCSSSGKEDNTEKKREREVWRLWGGRNVHRYVCGMCAWQCPEWKCRTWTVDWNAERAGDWNVYSKKKIAENAGSGIKSTLL